MVYFSLLTFVFVGGFVVLVLGLWLLFLFVWGGLFWWLLCGVGYVCGFLRGFVFRVGLLVCWFVMLYCCLFGVMFNFDYFFIVITRLWFWVVWVSGCLWLVGVLVDLVGGFVWCVVCLCCFGLVGVMFVDCFCLRGWCWVLLLLVFVWLLH